MPFWSRVLVLITLLALIAFWDYRRTRRWTRGREYVFLITIALSGGVFGLAADLVSSWISADYFALGKELGAGPALRSRAIALGFQAGFVAGAVTAALLLVANATHKKRPALDFRRLSIQLVKPFGAALICAFIFAALFYFLDPLRARPELLDSLSPELTDRFLMVWGSHCGFYLGALAGLLQAFVDVRKERKKLLETEGPVIKALERQSREQQKARKVNLAADGTRDITVVEANLEDPGHQKAILYLLDEYATEPVVSGNPPNPRARARIIPGLQEHPTSLVLLAVEGDEVLGLAICFRVFSTFAGMPLLNLHDIAVRRERRRQGIGQQLLGAVEKHARRMGCCGVSLEVNAKNESAQDLYRSFDFIDEGQLFWKKPLE